MARRARASQSGRRLGKQPPRYRFFLNPYTDVRFTTCPQCRGKTSQRKLPLVIHIDPDAAGGSEQDVPVLSPLRPSDRPPG